MKKNEKNEKQCKTSGNKWKTMKKMENNAKQSKTNGKKMKTNENNIKKRNIFFRFFKKEKAI